MQLSLNRYGGIKNEMIFVSKNMDVTFVVVVLAAGTALSRFEYMSVIIPTWSLFNSWAANRN